MELGHCVPLVVNTLFCLGGVQLTVPPSHRRRRAEFPHLVATTTLLVAAAITTATTLAQCGIRVSYFCWKGQRQHLSPGTSEDAISHLVAAATSVAAIIATATVSLRVLDASASAPAPNP